MFNWLKNDKLDESRIKSMQESLQTQLKLKKLSDFYLQKELHHLGINLRPVAPYFSPAGPRGITYEYVCNNGVIHDRKYSFEELQRILPYEDKK